MNYLIDTNCLIYYYKKTQKSFYNWFSSIDSKNIYISNLTIFELLSGFYTTESKKDIDYVNKIMSFYNLLEKYTIEEAILSARLQSKLRRKGIQLKSLDLHIASQAISNNLTLVTFNKKDFVDLQEMGLQLKTFDFNKNT